jgi:methylenetetrahydrofolate dehydrogenase (NADP+) / methenyltetrahydrofolate cyclohydrolase
MQLLDGKQTAAHYIQDLKRKTAALVAEGKRPPHLAAILVGNNGASETYVGSKVKTCNEIGYGSTLLRLPDTITENKLLNQIQALNNDENIDGILVQLPLPAHVSSEKVINAISPEKDVDGFHPVSVGRMVGGLSTFIPATPFGILLLLEHYKIDTRGKHAVVIGRSHIVGTPMSILLSRNNYPGNCTVTIVHSHTYNLPEIVGQGDIVVAALGRPLFVTGDMIKPGAVVIDVGITRVTDETKKSGFSLKGDVDFNSAAPKSSYITPVPGGVGPMTIAALMVNTWKALENKKENN